MRPWRKAYDNHSDPDAGRAGRTSPATSLKRILNPQRHPMMWPAISARFVARHGIDTHYFEPSCIELNLLGHRQGTRRRPVQVALRELRPRRRRGQGLPDTGAEAEAWRCLLIPYTLTRLSLWACQMLGGTRHVLPFNSRNEGSKCASMMWRATGLTYIARHGM